MTTTPRGPETEKARSSLKEAWSSFNEELLTPVKEQGKANSNDTERPEIMSRHVASSWEYLRTLPLEERKKFLWRDWSQELLKLVDAEINKLFLPFHGGIAPACKLAIRAEVPDVTSNLKARLEALYPCPNSLLPLDKEGNLNPCSGTMQENDDFAEALREILRALLQDAQSIVAERSRQDNSDVHADGEVDKGEDGGEVVFIRSSKRKRAEDAGEVESKPTIKASNDAVSDGVAISTPRKTPVSIFKTPSKKFSSLNKSLVRNTTISIDRSEEDRDSGEDELEALSQQYQVAQAREAEVRKRKTNLIADIKAKILKSEERRAKMEASIAKLELDHP